MDAEHRPEGSGASGMPRCHFEWEFTSLNSHWGIGHCIALFQHRSFVLPSAAICSYHKCVCFVPISVARGWAYVMVSSFCGSVGAANWIPLGGVATRLPWGFELSRAGLILFCAWRPSGVRGAKASAGKESHQWLRILCTGVESGAESTLSISKTCPLECSAHGLHFHTFSPMCEVLPVGDAVAPSTTWARRRLTWRECRVTSEGVSLLQLVKWRKMGGHYFSLACLFHSLLPSLLWYHCSTSFFAATAANFFCGETCVFRDYRHKYFLHCRDLGGKGRELCMHLTHWNQRSCHFCPDQAHISDLQFC